MAISLNVSNFDLLITVIFFAVSLINPRAFFVLAFMTVYLLLVNSLDRYFYAYITYSIFCFFFAYQIFIKIPLAFRFAFSCFGFVYFIGALDQFTYYHFDLNTQFDRIQPYLVTFINAYVLAYLLSDWRRNNVVGLADYCAMWLRRSKIRSTHNR